MFFRNKLSKRISLLILLVIIVFFVKGFFHKKPQKGMPARPVETALAIKKDVPNYIESFGNLIPPNDVNIKSQVTGEIKEVNFTEGTEVGKGDLLFTIDPRPFQADLDKARAALMQDLAGLKLKKNTFERNKKLFEKQLISQQDFDTYSADLAGAAAKVRLDNAAVELAKINLDYCYIRSPVDGLTGKRLVDVGNIVTGNSGPTLVNIKTIDTLYVDFTISETDLPKVRKAMDEGRLKVEVSMEQENGSSFKGELLLLDNTVDNTTGTVALRAAAANDERKLWAGQFVTVRLILGIKKDAVLVPYEAVQMGQQGNYLFVATEDNKADLRIVKTGSRQESSIVIEEGVRPGEKVVTLGQLGLWPGAAVIDAVQLKAMQEQSGKENKPNKNKKE